MYDYILDKTYNESRYWLLSSYDFTKLLCCMSSQPWENIELILKLSMALTSKWDTKVVICSLWIGSLLIKTSGNRYSQDKCNDISCYWDSVSSWLILRTCDHVICNCSSTSLSEIWHISFVD